MNQGELLSAFLIDLQRIFRTKIVPKELSYSQALAILVIPDGGIEMSELAWVMGLENSTVTRLIGRLETNGFIKRKKSEINACAFPNLCYTVFVMRVNAKYFVEVKSATGGLEFVHWFAPSLEGLEKAIACAREA